MDLLEPGGDFGFALVQHPALGDVGQGAARGARTSHLEPEARFSWELESGAGKLGPPMFVGIAICEEIFEGLAFWDRPRLFWFLNCHGALVLCLVR